MAEMIKFGDFASFKYGKMPNKKKVTESGKYPVYSGYRYVGFYDEYNTEANQLKVKVPLHIGSVNNIDDSVRVRIHQKISCYNFFTGIRGKGVNPR